MRRFARWLVLLLAVGLQSLATRAGEPAPPQPAPEKARPERVHLGSTSVTVVDEHEPVDDVITRIRKEKSETATVPKAKPAEIRGQGSRAAKATDIRQGSGRAALRSQRDQATARADAERRKDERRERAASSRTRLEQKQHH